MERLGTAIVDIRTLDGYDEVMRRSTHQHVLSLSENVRAVGLINRPWVREKDKRLVCGFDRLGSLVAAGVTHSEVELIDCDDVELELIRVSENAQRRHEPGEQTKVILSLVKAHEEQVRQELEMTPGESPKGKRKGAKRIARERAAKDIGIKPESVRRQEHRALKKVDHEKAQPKTKFPTLGRSVPDTWLAGVELAERLLNEAHNKVKLALGEVTRLQNSNTPYPNGALQKLYEMVQDTGNYIKDCKPLSVCPWCKMIPEVTVCCSACRATGFATQRVKSSIPEELARADDPLVAWNGKYVSIKQFGVDTQAVAHDLDEPSDEELSAAQEGLGEEL